MSEHRSARPAHRLRNARHHLEEAQRELQQACDLAQTGGGPRQLEAVLAHLRLASHTRSWGFRDGGARPVFE
ncbi:MAG: hypothetical protein J2P40_00900, partial [Candidatus Dormibacteraeota bacterium]|nr:hypothetical protein [Candidatus Dormibacteraeota bacterium]MBO0759805.1 hypothetical protein [Candidatus Dormibacteraeota bacterium]